MMRDPITKALRKVSEQQYGHSPTPSLWQVLGYTDNAVNDYLRLQSYRGHHQRQDNNPPPPNLDALGRGAKRIYGDHEATELLSGCLLADLACLLQELV